MNIWQKARAAMGMKLLKSEMRFGGSPMTFFDFLPRPDRHDMAREVGDGTSSDVVMTPIRWMQRAFMESRIAVMQDDEIVEGHPLPELIENPNPFYAAEHLYAGTLFSLALDGNAYWIKVMNGFGEIVELWYVPHFLIQPKWPDHGRVFISHYEYTVQGQVIPLPPEGVVHFRDGIDPQNVRKGLSPLKGLLREVWTDNEAAMFTAAMLRNSGIPGVVISPKDSSGDIDQKQAEQAEESFRYKFGGERRGNALVMNLPMDVTTLGFNPSELDLGSIRNVSEERVTAALGVPAAVVGFGAGLQQTKVGATMRELRRLAWDNGVIPLQRTIAGDVKRQLLPDFVADGETVEFDNSRVSALQEDEKERDERITNLVNGGIWTRGEGRAATGQEATEADDVFLIPINMIEVPRTGMPEPRSTEEEEPESTDPEERARLAILFKRETPESLLEQQMAVVAPRAVESERVKRFARSIDVIRRRLAVPFEGELLSFFDQLGEATAAAARFLAEERAGRYETKRDPMIAARIAEGINLLGLERALKTLYESHYLRVGQLAGKEIGEFLGLATGLPDPAARALLATGGRRAGLIDLSAKTKRIIFDALVEGRIAGKAGENLARFIREHVERGPWSSPTVRARVIARTETAFATNISVIEGARSIGGVEKMMMHDARSGDTDETCEALNGRMVTLQEAQELAFAEHPNGTRSFTPLTPQLIEEMQS